MKDDPTLACRYFVSYSGIKLPLKLINPLEEQDIGNRNVFYRGYFDQRDRLIGLQKIVYGEVDLEHQYEYFPNGALQSARITDAEDEVTVLRFTETGDLLQTET